MKLQLVLLPLFLHSALAQNQDDSSDYQPGPITITAAPSAQGFTGSPMNVSCSFSRSDFLRNQYLLLVKLNVNSNGNSQLIFGINTNYAFQVLRSVFMRSTIYLYRLSSTPDMRLIIAYRYMNVSDTGSYACYLGQAAVISNTLSLFISNQTVNATQSTTGVPMFSTTRAQNGLSQTTQHVTSPPAVRVGILPDFANYSSGSASDFALGAYCNASNCVLQCLDCGKLSPAVIVVISIVAFLLVLASIAVFCVVRYKHKSAMLAAASAALSKFKQVKEKQNETPYANFENSSEPPSYDDVVAKNSQEAPQYVTFGGV